MASGFRSKMTWLHTWSGLILGWLLFAVFVTGTSAYYRSEITLWMKPELHKSQVSEKTFDVAVDKAIESSKKFTSVNVSLPNGRTNLISIREDGAISGNSNTGEKKAAGAARDTQTRGQRQNENASEQRGSRDNDQAKGQRQENAGAQKNASNQKGNQQQRQKRRRVPPKYYDATTGDLIKETTKTAGGNFLYRFHFELYSMPRNIARWIVGIATIAMLVAIFTGIVIHKRIFKDVFTFRNKHTTRGWMDAHILPAVAALPFLIMITYSGLLLFTNTLMPWGMQMYYGDDFRAYRDARGQVGKPSQKLEEVKNSIQNSRDNNQARGQKQDGNTSNQRADRDSNQARGEKQNTNTQKGNRENNEARGSRQEGFNGQNKVSQNNQKGNRTNGGDKNSKQAKQGKPQINEDSVAKNTNASRILNANAQRYINKYQNKNSYRILNTQANREIELLNKRLAKTQKLIVSELSKEQLVVILKDAEKLWPNNVGNFSIKKDTDKNSIQIEVNPKDPTTIFAFKGSREVAVYDGITGKLISSSSPPEGNSITANTNTTLISLHQALFAGSGLRFIFFVSGIFGVVISGTGLVLWVQKRKKKENTKDSFGFKLVDKLNVGTIMGIFIALAAYFIVNRVTTSSDKSELEIAGFFIAWGLSYLHAFIRNVKKAWLEQAIFAVALYAALPIINAITTFDSFTQVYSRDNILIYFDIFFIFMALVFALISFIIIRKSKKGVA